MAWVEYMAIGSMLVMGMFFGFPLGYYFNKISRREMAWRMNKAHKGFATIVRSGRKGKRMDWDTREPSLTVGAATYIIYQEDVFDVNGVPNVLINARVGRSIPCENLPSDTTGLYNPSSIYSYGIMVYNLMEAKVDGKNRKLMLQLLYIAAGAAALAVLMGFLSFNQAGSATAAGEGAKALCGEMVNRTIPMVR